MSFKQRKHTTNTTSKYPIDHYPEIDVFIPHATQAADNLFPDRSEPGYNAKWTKCFMDNMDSSLQKQGLRYL